MTSSLDPCSGGKLIPRPSFFQLDNIRKARRRGEPWHLIVHEDLLIFRKPTTASAEELAVSRPEPGRQPPPLAAWWPGQHGRQAA